MAKKINVCGCLFEKVYKTKLESRKGPALGMCDVNKRKFYIKKGLSKEKELEVLFHEIFHSIDESLDLKLGEKKVTILSLVVLDTIKRNKLKLY